MKYDEFHALRDLHQYQRDVKHECVAVTVNIFAQVFLSKYSFKCSKYSLEDHDMQKPHGPCTMQQYLSESLRVGRTPRVI